MKQQKTQHNPDGKGTLKPGQAIRVSHHGMPIEAVIVDVHEKTYSVQVPSGKFRMPFQLARPV